MRPVLLLGLVACAPVDDVKSVDGGHAMRADAAAETPGAMDASVEEPDAGVPDVFFSQVWSEVLSGTCSGCHTPVSHVPLTVETEAATYATLLNGGVTASDRPGLLVNCGRSPALKSWLHASPF